MLFIAIPFHPGVERSLRLPIQAYKNRAMWTKGQILFRPKGVSKNWSFFAVSGLSTDPALASMKPSGPYFLAENKNF